MSLKGLIKRVAGRAGVQVAVHPARRRVQLLQHHGIDLVLDVGAAHGQTGSELRRFGYRGAIVSFEPLTEAYARLTELAAGDPMWSTRNVALGSAAGRAALHVSEHSDSSSLLPVLDRSVRAASHTRTVATREIEVVRLDEIADEVIGRARRPFLKVDVQGYEVEVLEGAAATLPRIVGMQLEMSLVPLYEGGALFAETFAAAYAAGFELRGVEPGFLDPSTGELLQLDGIFLR